jgi:site-specific DNA recombinase
LKPQKPAIGYVRVSLDSQVQEGVSLEAQRARIEAWSKANEYKLQSVHIDAGLSGKRADNRPALQKALEEATQLKAVLVVYSLSRLARSTKDTLAISERLDKAGADLVSLSEKIDSTSASGKMVFRLLAVLAEFERDLISERTKSALSHLKKKNFRIGAIPFGFTLNADGKSLQESASEQDAIKKILKFRENGMTLAAIAKELEELKVACKNAKRWHPQMVLNIVNRYGLTNGK